eukprot:5028463-Amphidinium_carterae.1
MALTSSHVKRRSDNHLLQLALRLSLSLSLLLELSRVLSCTEMRASHCKNESLTCTLPTSPTRKTITLNHLNAMNKLLQYPLPPQALQA